MTPEQKSDKRLELEKQAIETQNALRFQALTGINTGDATMSDNDVKLMSGVTQVSVGAQGGTYTDSLTDEQAFLYHGGTYFTEGLEKKYPGVVENSEGKRYETNEQFLADEGRRDAAYDQREEIFAEGARDYLADSLAKGKQPTDALKEKLEGGFSAIRSSEFHDGTPEEQGKIYADIASGKTPNDYQARRNEKAESERLAKEEARVEKLSNRREQREADKALKHEALERLEAIKQQHLKEAQFPQSGYSGGYGGFNQNRQMQGVGGGAEPQATDQFSQATEAYTSEVQATLQEAAEILQWHAQQLKMVRRILLEAGT